MRPCGAKRTKQTQKSKHSNKRIKPNNKQQKEHDLFGSRDFLDADGAERALAPLLAVNALIRKVRLSTKSFGRDAAAVAARALGAVAHCLEHADMSDVIAGRAVSVAGCGLWVVSGCLVWGGGWGVGMLLFRCWVVRVGGGARVVVVCSNNSNLTR
jgi:hypothetical protein